MRKLAVLVLAFLTASPWALSAWKESTQKHVLGSLSDRTPRFVTKLEYKEVQSYSVEELYSLQRDFPEEQVINLHTNNYLVQFDQESAARYLDVSVSEPQSFLRQVSGSMLGLILYRLGGDGTDHYQNCEAWLSKQLPQTQLSTVLNEWTATYAGIIVDFGGNCRGFGGPSVFYVYIQVNYSPVTSEGEIFLGGQDLLGSRWGELFSINGDNN